MSWSLIDQFGVSSPYGPRAGGFHSGVDTPCPMNTPIPSPFSGVVQFAGQISAAAAGYANETIVILQRPNNTFAVFGHLSRPALTTGQQVAEGQVIAYSGNSGYSTGPHLHIELRQGTKTNSRGLLSYPSIDITPFLTTKEDDMTNREFIQLLALVGQRQRNYPKEALEHWERALASGTSPEAAMRQFLDDGEVYMTNAEALMRYQEAREAAGAKYPGGAKQFGIDRVLGGDSLASVMQRDIPHYLTKEALANQLLAKDAPEPLTDQDRQDLDLGRNFRNVVMEVTKK